jgi:hypothetical protein
MHGGFGGGGGGGMGHSGGGGMGHSGGGGGHHSGGGGGHHSSGGGGHHGGELNPTAIASHGLGGPSQSIFSHIAALGQNPQGIIGHIASFLTGQQVTHHSAGASQQSSQHIADQSWTSAALQVEKSGLWKQRIAKMPAVHIMGVFLLIVGWLFFLGMLRHGDAEHTAKSPMPSQSEWRQQLTGNGPAEQTGEAASEAPAQGGFGQAAPNVSAFGMPRDVEGAVAPNLSNYVPQSYVMTNAPMAYGQSSYGAQSTGTNPMMDPSMTAPGASGYAAPVATSAPAPQLGRRSFSARVALANPQEAQPAPTGYMANDLYAPIESRRSFHHRVVAER